MVGETLSRRTELMKKLWKMRKDSKAVSPVIATILMVAITVVLAAVLYVMVMGFGGSNSQSTPTATMTYTKANATGYIFTVASVTRNDVKMVDLGVLVTPTASSVGKPIIGTGATGNLIAGDQIYVWGLAAGSYTLTLQYLPTGGAAYQTTWTVA